jgi:MFS transporter, Spinster family, sphingosine-1-phosphate transporter
MVGTIAGGYLADALNRRYPGARVLVCGIGFLLSAPAFALALLTHNLTVFTIFFIITAILLTFYQGPSTAAIQDVVPSFLRATAVCVVLLIAHLLGDAFSPTIVSIIAAAFDPTHGQHFRDGVAGQDLGMALLVTCVPALVLAGGIGIFGARWMGADIVAAEQADRAAKAAR